MEAGLQLRQLETGLGAQMAVVLLRGTRPQGGQGRGLDCRNRRTADLAWRGGERQAQRPP